MSIISNYRVFSYTLSLTRNEIPNIVQTFVVSGHKARFFPEEIPTTFRLLTDSRYIQTRFVFFLCDFEIRSYHSPTYLKGGKILGEIQAKSVYLSRCIYLCLAKWYTISLSKPFSSRWAYSSWRPSLSNLSTQWPAQCSLAQKEWRFLVISFSANKQRCHFWHHSMAIDADVDTREVKPTLTCSLVTTSFTTMTALSCVHITTTSTLAAWLAGSWSTWSGSSSRLWCEIR